MYSTVKKTRKTVEVAFLDFKIFNTGNSDGWVLEGNSPSEKDLLYIKGHLGNYSSVESAKRYAVVYYMMFRPNKFGPHIVNRVMSGVGCSHEWFALRSCLRDEGIEMPEEITHSDDCNFSIIVCGERISLK